MRTISDIYQSIQNKFASWTGKQIQPGSVIDFYTMAVSETMQDAHQEIEDNRNPHIFTRLTGQELDDTGFFVNCPRIPGEDDRSYLWRIINWLPRVESSNTIAIRSSLTNLTHASSAEFVPYSHGTGTATLYVVPKTYDTETAAKALEEAMNRLEPVKSPGLYIEYIVPAIRSVRPIVLMETSGGDTALIRSNIEAKVADYVNAIAPGDWLEIGNINRIGLDESLVRYFSVLSVYVNGVETKDTSILQELTGKFLFDTITWIEEDDNA